jgi:hypothetical protein
MAEPEEQVRAVQLLQDKLEEEVARAHMDAVVAEEVAV